jgi:hypothetical protein
MRPRSELIDIVDGSGRLQVRGTESAFGLFVDGISVAANWYDCAGSIGQYFYRVPDCSLEQSAAMVRDAVRDTLQPSDTLAKRFWPLFSQFASGPYRLDYDEVGPHLQLRELGDGSNSPAPAHLNQYANESRFHHVLLPTQRAETRDQDRILAWALAIEAGQRPTIITTTLDAADSEIILDGHHKCAAYEMVGAPARRLAIVPVAPLPLRLEDWPGGQLPNPPESWPKALALKRRLWPQDAEPLDTAFEYQRRAEIAARLGIAAPNLVGFLEASHVYLYETIARLDHVTGHPRVAGTERGSCCGRRYCQSGGNQKSNQ